MPLVVVGGYSSRETYAQTQLPEKSTIKALTLALKSDE